MLKIEIKTWRLNQMHINSGYSVRFPLTHEVHCPSSTRSEHNWSSHLLWSNPKKIIHIECTRKHSASHSWDADPGLGLLTWTGCWSLQTIPSPSLSHLRCTSFPLQISGIFKTTLNQHVHHLWNIYRQYTTIYRLLDCKPFMQLTWARMRHQLYKAGSFAGWLLNKEYASPTGTQRWIQADECLQTVCREWVKSLLITNHQLE